MVQILNYKIPERVLLNGAICKRFSKVSRRWRCAACHVLQVFTLLFAIPKRDQLEHKENQTKRKMTRKPRGHVKILVYRMWGIVQTRKRKRRTCTPSFTCILCINFHVVYTSNRYNWRMGGRVFQLKASYTRDLLEDSLLVQGWPAVDGSVIWRKPFFFLSNLLCLFSRC